MFDIRIIVMLAITIWVTGCAISPDEMDEKIKECQKYGFKYVIERHGTKSTSITDIRCEPLPDVPEDQS